MPKQSKERLFCAVDAEGDYGLRGLQGVAIYSDKVQEYVKDHNHVKDVLYDHAIEGYTFICHNASYDIPVVWGQLGLKPEYTYYNGRLHHGSWKYSKRKGAAQIWDTLDLSGGLSLEALGKELHLPKYPTPQRLLGKDPDKYEWQCEKHNVWECEDCYAIRDAEIAYEFMRGLKTLLAAWGVRPLPRISGIALDVWKQLDHPQDIGIHDRGIRSLARKAYYGGRTECFKYGYVAPCYIADVTSMYPSAMLETAFPAANKLIHTQGMPVDALPLQCEGAATVDISIPQMHVPPLPYSIKGDRVYPVGRLIGTWTLLELRYAVSIGCTINKVNEVVYATDTCHPFTNYIGVLWAQREAYKAANDAREVFSKLLMNNLYGRLGVREKPERTIIKQAPPNWDSRNNPNHYDDSLVGEVLMLSKSVELSFGSDWSNVLWAAQITSAARVKLHKLMVLQGIHLTYCDTDSIFSTQPIEGTGQGLGQLKSEGQFQSTIIVQPKLYALQDLHGEWCAKAKGVGRGHALRFLQGHAVTYDKPIKPREGFWRHLTPGQWISVTKQRQQPTYRRQPRNILALADDYGYTDTDPLVNGPLSDYPQITE